MDFNAVFNNRFTNKLHPPHLINVATVPCEIQNTENVILQWEFSKGNCIKCITASSKWIRVIMCLKFTHLGLYSNACMKRFRTSMTCKMLDANLVRLWLGQWGQWRNPYITFNRNKQVKMEWTSFQKRRKWPGKEMHGLRNADCQT